MKKSKSILFVFSLVVLTVSCTSITYTPTTRKINRIAQKSICDSLYLLPDLADISLLHVTPPYFTDSLGNIKRIERFVYSENDASLTREYKKFVVDYFWSKLSTKVKYKDLILKPYQSDSIKARIIKMAKVFYYEKKKNYTIDLSDLDLKKKGYVLICYSEIEHKDHAYWKSENRGTVLTYYRSHSPSAIIYSHACVLELSSGKLLYYKYHFDGIAGGGNLFYFTLNMYMNRIINPFVRSISCSVSDKSK